MVDKKTFIHIDGQTPDLTDDAVSKLLELFPEIKTDGNRIDFDKLKTILSKDIDDSPEHFDFTWNGKKRAMKNAQTSSTGTLRPQRDKSVNWDETENVYIEGDNLEALKLLQKPYNGKIKMIYLDPPYNTGKDFVYKDNFRDGIENYLEQTGQVDSEGNRLSVNSETSGRYHTEWLNMMYPRLKVARNLLSENGMIFISIDFNESSNLRKLLDEIFGENNFIADIAWRRSDNQANIGSFATVRDSILVYSKNYQKMDLGKLPLSEKAQKEYAYKDDTGRYRRGNLRDEVRGRFEYDIISPLRKLLKGPWMISKEEFEELKKNNMIHWPGNGGIPSTKIYLKDAMKKGQIPTDFWDTSFGTNQRGNKEIKELFGYRAFDFLKPQKLMKAILNLGNIHSDEIVMDIFSGSASTAHAVMSLNIDDREKRKFIMIQLPEKLENIKSEAYSNGYRTITDIAEERIRRVGQKISDENPSLLNGLDVGFKVFSLDTSNVIAWEGVKSDEISFDLEDKEPSIVNGRSNEDILYELLIKQGLELTAKIVRHVFQDNTIFEVNNGLVYVVIGESIKRDAAINIVNLQKSTNVDNDQSRVIFMDEGFKTASDKLNSWEELRESGFLPEYLQSF